MDIKNLEKRLKLARSIEKRNQAFKRLSKSKKRVAIAKDVLASLKSKQFIPKAMVYFEWRRQSSIDEEACAVDLLASGERCDVCALGALFTCAVKVTNGLRAHDMYYSEQTEMREYLKPYFSEKQLGLVECAFEKDASFAQSGDDELGAMSNEAFRAKDFCKGSAKECMIAIMKNIIKNGGTFVP